MPATPWVFGSIEDAGLMTLYFAYGSNMNTSQMNRRCPGAELIGMARLTGYRFIINHRGVATLIPESEAYVLGVLWEISQEHERYLDRYEGYGHGLYDKCYRDTRLDSGKDIPAMVYIDHRNAELGAPRDGYLESIIEGAEQHGLPEEYVAILRSWPRRRDFRTFNRLVNGVKSGEGIRPPIQSWRRRTVDRLGQRRDDLILRALTVYVSEGFAKDTFEHVLHNVVLQEVKKAFDEFGFEEVARLAVEQAASRRFLVHLEHIETEVKKRSFMDCVDDSGELAGDGIIITVQAERPHADGDRLIVTKHAPVVAYLWKRIFEGEHNVHPRTCRFLDSIADLLEDYPELDDAVQLTRDIFRCVRAQVESHVQELANAIEGIASSMVYGEANTHV